MPPRNLQDETLAFLYLCLINSDYKQINFQVIATLLGINVPAARMRFTRLRKTAEQASLSAFGVFANEARARKGGNKHKNTECEDDDECGNEKVKIGKKRRVKTEESDEPSASAKSETMVKRKHSSPVTIKEEKHEADLYGNNDNVPPMMKKRPMGPVDTGTDSPTVTIKKEAEELNLYGNSDEEPVMKKRQRTKGPVETVILSDDEDKAVKWDENLYALRDTVDFLAPLLQAQGRVVADKRV